MMMMIKFPTTTALALVLTLYSATDGFCMFSEEGTGRPPLKTNGSRASTSEVERTGGTPTHENPSEHGSTAPSNMSTKKQTVPLEQFTKVAALAKKHQETASALKNTLTEQLNVAQQAVLDLKFKTALLIRNEENDEWRNIQSQYALDRQEVLTRKVLEEQKHASQLREAHEKNVLTDQLTEAQKLLDAERTHTLSLTAQLAAVGDEVETLKRQIAVNKEYFDILTTKEQDTIIRRMEDKKSASENKNQTPAETTAQQTQKQRKKDCSMM